MNKNPIRQALFVLTIVYGLVIGLLAILDVDALGVVAAAGAVLIGLGWGCSGMLTREKARD